MILNVKNLKGEIMSVECSPETDTVQTIKEKIEVLSNGEIPVSRAKLIFTGKVLKDTQTVAELNIKADDFLVCMVSKPTAAAVPAPTVPTAAPTPVTPTSSFPPLPPAPTPTPTPAVAAAAAFAYPDALANLVSMGFPDAECRAALNAARGEEHHSYIHSFTIQCISYISYATFHFIPYHIISYHILLNMEINTHTHTPNLL